MKAKNPTKPILPCEWMETFGLDVDAHTASTRIDLAEGFVTAETAAEEAGPSSPPADGITEETK